MSYVYLVYIPGIYFQTYPPREKNRLGATYVSYRIYLAPGSVVVVAVRRN